MGTKLRDRTSRLPQKFAQIKPVGIGEVGDGKLSWKTMEHERRRGSRQFPRGLVSRASSWLMMITAGRKRRPPPSAFAGYYLTAYGITGFDDINHAAPSALT